MSYTVDLIPGRLADDNKDAWAHVNEFRKTYYGDKRDKAPALVALHAALLQHPFISRQVDTAPWPPKLHCLALRRGLRKRAVVALFDNAPRGLLPLLDRLLESHP